MRASHMYLLLCVLGTIVPYSAFGPWLAEHGPDMQQMARELTANRISMFFGWDVFMSAATLFIFIGEEGRRNRVPHIWAPLLGTLLVGVSLGLPLLLYLREREIETGRLAAA